MRPQRLIRGEEQCGCPLANATMALWTLNDAYIAEGDPDGAAIARELWAEAIKLRPPGKQGDEPAV